MLYILHVLNRKSRITGAVRGVSLSNKTSPGGNDMNLAYVHTGGRCKGFSNVFGFKRWSKSQVRVAPRSGIYLVSPFV